jgi:hypothetical protein
MSKIVLDLPVAVHIIIKSQLLALEDVAFGENSHPHTFADDPFRDVTVWVAGVIEPYRPFWSRQGTARTRIHQPVARVLST